MRRIEGTTRLSKHAIGCAFDINPMQNPCFDYAEDGLSVKKVVPANGRHDPREPGTLYRAHPLVQLMLRLGWEWGGDWTTLIDYQHFQIVPPQLAVYVT